MKKIYCLVFLFLIPALNLAMPPRPGTGAKDPTLGHPAVERPNPDAFTLIKGDDGFQVAVATLSKGTKRYPVLLIDFSDRTWNIGRTKFDSLLFVPGGLATGSLVDYYRQVSYGKDTVSGNCYGWFHSGNTQAYYGDSSYGLKGAFPRNAAGLVMQALQLADATVDFTQFSRTGGKLELLIVVHAGPGAEGKPDSTNWIWSHNAALSGWGIPQANRTFDGVVIDQYTMQPEISALDTTYRTKQIEIGVFAHELGHALGLPDLYDVDGSSEGVGRYCLMGAGSWGVDYYNSTPHRPAHLSPWAKKFLGWITPQTVSNDTANLKLVPVQTSGQVLRLNTPASNEYFLIENRQKVGFDSLLDGQGLLIWHIDETVIGSGLPNNQVNINEAHKGVDLEQAKGSQSLDFPANPQNWANRNRGDYKDFYPYSTNNAFADYTTPNSKNYSGAVSGVAVTNIAPGLGDTMVCDIGIPGFVIGLLCNPAFPQYLTIGAVAQNALKNPERIDTALMQNPSGSTALNLAQIGTSRSYQTGYQLSAVGIHTIHIAARDSADTTRWRRADRSFEVVAGKASGGEIAAIGGAMILNLAAGALSTDMLLPVIAGADAQGSAAEPLSPPLGIGPQMPLNQISTLSLRYDPDALGGRDAHKLAIYRAEGLSWRYLGGILDPGQSRVITEIDRLGIYQLAWSPDNPPLPEVENVSIQAEPNPFSKDTHIKFQVPRAGMVSLKVYNVTGQCVKRLISEPRAAGFYVEGWDGRDDGGRLCPNGVYLYRLEAGRKISHGRMIKVK